MKKLFALLAVVLAVASCQKDVNSLEVNVGEQEAVITVALPEATRANSLGGALDNNVLDNYDLRFILEIYQGEDCYRDESISDDTTASFEVRLVPGHEYKIAVWADFVANDAVELAENDIFYNTNGDKGLQNITILNNAAMTEARDAYYGTYTLTDDKTAASIPTITLKRPFAKVRVITNDLEECAEMSGMVPASATVTYAAFVNDQFNVLTGAIGSSAAVKTKTVSYATEDLVYDASNLFVDYILVDQTKPSVVKFDLNVTDIVNRSFNTDIAVEANKITTIIGNILTDGTDINVKVDGDFADKESEIPAELLRVLQNGGEYTLTKDLKVYRDLRVNAGADVTLNLGGKTIEMVSGYEEANGAFVVEGNLTIEGEGTVKSTTRAIWTWKGNTVIKGGKFIGTSETIYASAGGKVEIFGGEFEATVLEETSFAAPQYTVLNHQDNNASITVYGGSFKNFNPENNFSEGANTNFCAEGCVVTKDGDWYNVTGYTPVASATEIQEALANGENVILSGDIAVTQSEAGSNGYGATGINTNGGIIDGNGKSFRVNAWGTWDSAINTTGGTIKNLNVTGGMRGIFVNHNSTYSEKVILENVTIDGTVYTISCDQGTNNGLEATNCTFNGWTSYAATLGATKFVGCSFGEGQGYAGCRPYATTEFVNCAFEAGYELDPCATVTFENCTIGGVALTADNLATLVTSNIANATVSNSQK